MAAWEIPGSRFARSGLRPRRLRPPHARVGIFIVNNRRETMTPSCLQPAVCIAILACRSVARSRAPAWPAGRVPALAFLKLHGCGLLYFPVFSANTTNPRRAAAARVRATKNPARSPARAADVLSMNTLFWKILVTRVKRMMKGNLMRRSFLRFQRGRAAWRGAGETLSQRITP